MNDSTDEYGAAMSDSTIFIPAAHQGRGSPFPTNGHDEELLQRSTRLRVGADAQSPTQARACRRQRRLVAGLRAAALDLARCLA